MLWWIEVWAAAADVLVLEAESSVLPFGPVPAEFCGMVRGVVLEINTLGLICKKARKLNLN